MRITKIKVDLGITKSVNLKEINLTKKPLGSVVALVGQNGAGKSRILNFVESYFENLTFSKYIENHFEFIPQNLTEPHLQSIDASKRIYNRLQKIKPNDSNYNPLVIQLNQNFNGFSNSLKTYSKTYIKKIDNDELQKIKTGINNNSLSFEKILTNIHYDNYVKNPQVLINNQPNNNILLNEFNQFNNTSTIDYFKKLTIDIVTDEFNLFIKNRNDLEVINKEIKKNKSFQLFEKFQIYVKQFLGKEFSYKQDTKDTTIDSTLHFNDQPFNIDLLSPGQKTLFAYAILFFYLDTNSKTNIKESIIIIDEPEKHLHPEAQIKLIDAIKSIIKDKGQLWIATHSIHILSHLDCDEILMVKDDGIIAPSRTTPGKSFNDLMGLENHIDELITFINSISQWAYGNFMVQCFKEPDVIFGKNPDDIQFTLFKEFILEKNEVNILDYGAGKGRIGYTMNEDEEVVKKIRYSAFEPDNSNFELLKNVPNLQNIFSSKDDIPNDTFDCVLLCNVLHEINPKEWIDVLLNIRKILKRDGYLLIIEDKFLPKGENAHEFGYLILGTEETKKLLKTDEVLELKSNDKELENRILFNAFKKENINPDNKSVIDAISILNKNSYTRLKDLRGKADKDISVGRKYANETQLFINSQMALEKINNKKSNSKMLD